MFCSACGTPIIAGVNVCSRCGKPAASFAAPGQPEVNPLATASLMARPGVIPFLAALDLFFGAIWLLGAAALSFSILGRKSDTADIVILLIMGVFGLLAIVARVGLLRMKEYRRMVQFGLSGLGLLGIPLGTIISALILYYLTRPGVRALFSGRRAEEITPEETAAVLQLSSELGSELRSSTAQGGDGVRASFFCCSAGSEGKSRRSIRLRKAEPRLTGGTRAAFTGVRQSRPTARGNPKHWPHL